MSKLILVFCGMGLAMLAQEPKNAAPGTYLSRSEMANELKTAPNQEAALIDRPVRVVDAHGHYLGVASVRRISADVNALVHEKIDEIYYVQEGAGTLVTGGTLVDSKREDSSVAIGPGWRGSTIAGGQSKHVAPGDVIIIPAGTPHMFSQLEGTIHYLVYRVDTSKVIGLK
jgi:mannose-6-phosphate isomerase-like protein (cupin superfamily)